jgi:hypothetical protein|tara:strand:- start:9089 stop:11518 length:2430 start_codon:yes stop_codon:yes gene_type:complete
MADAKEIIISIQVKGAKAGSELDKTTKSTNKLARATKILSNLQKQEAIDLAKVNQQIKIQKEVNDAAARSSLGLASASTQSAMAAKAMRTNSGLNNAIIAESARLASDASYGFTAIANNLGQLVSLFSASANAAGGLRSAIAALFTAQSIFLISIQLLITYGNDIINFFKGSQKAADDFKDSLEDLEETVQSQRREMLGYIEVLKDTNISEEVRLNALKELEAASPGIVDSYDKQKTSLEDLTKQVEEYIRQQRLRGELDAILEANQELFAEREKIRGIQAQLDDAKTFEERKRIFEENASFMEKIFFESTEAYEAAGGKGYLARLAGLDEDVDYAELFRAQSEDTVNQFDTAVKRIIEIEKQLTAEPDDTDGGRAAQAAVARFGEFREARFVLDKDIEKIEQDSLARFLETEQAKLVQEELNQKNTYRVRFKTFVDTQKFRQQEFEEAQERRLKDFLNRKKDSEKTKQELQEDLNARKNFDEAILKSKQELNSSIEDGERELDEVLKAIEENYKDRRVILNKELAQEALELAYKLESIQAESFDKQSRLPEIFQSKSEEANLRYLQSQVKLQTDLVNIFKEGTVERMNAEIALAELQGKLADAQRDREIRRFNEIKEIYKQATGVITGISNTRKNIEINNARAELEARIAAGEDEIEAKKKYDAQVEEANKKAWKIEQGLKISRVIMDTYQAGILAYGSQLIVGDPTSPIRAQIAQALTLANGAAQIAAILATKYDSKNLKGVSGPSSGGRDVTVEAPDFNVVGASPESQLVGSIAPILSKPMKAFVVESEITDAQNNVANYRETSST